MKDTTKKNVLITGASSGIGESIARLLSAEGHSLMLVARRSDRLEKLAEELGDTCSWMQVDVTDKNQLQEAARAQIAGAGSVDVLVNNAGIMPVSPLIKGLTDDWDRMIDINIKGVLYGIHAVLGHMCERNSGHIINISSLAGMRVSPASAVYSGTKFAVRAIGEGLRQELAGTGVRVTTIYPGAFSTELAGSITDKDTLEGMRQRFSFPLGDPDRIADAVSYAMGQPAELSVSEMVVRPTAQPF